MALLEKVIVSVLSTIIFSLSLEAVEPYDGSFSLGVAFVYAIYSFPIYLIGGGLYAYLADTYIDKITFRHAFLKYSTGFITYAAGGALIASILLIVFGISNVLVVKLFIMSVLAALLFFHISIAVKKAFRSLMA